MTAGGTSTSPELPDEHGPLLSFAVPDDLLQAAVSILRTRSNVTLHLDRRSAADVAA